MTAKFSFLTLLCFGASAVMAGDAVDSINGKLDFSTGSMDSHWGENLTGSLSLPVATSFGLQLDGLYTRVGSEDFEGGGLHLFWRDSDEGMIGLTAGGINGDLLYGLQGGLEAEYYLNRFTFGANMGAATLQYDNSAPFIDAHPTDIDATAALSYYPVDNVMIQGAYSRLLDNNLYEMLVEYQTPVNGLSCFTELAAGDHGYDHVLFGLRFYFGKNKSLIHRHREDDPPNLLRRVLYTIGTYGAEWNRARQSYAEEHPGGGYSSGGGGYGSVTIINTEIP